MTIILSVMYYMLHPLEQLLLHFLFFIRSSDIATYI